MEFNALITCSSSDGAFIAIAVQDFIRTFDSLSGRQVGPNLRFHTDIITSIHISQDNLLVSGSYDCTIRIWDLNNQIQIGDPFIQDFSIVKYIKFVNSQVLASVRYRFIDIWNIHSRTVIHYLKCASDALTIDAGIQSKLVISTTESLICVWNVHSGKKFCIRDHFPNISTRISPNYKLIASGCQDYGFQNTQSKVIVRIWNTTKGKLLNKCALQKIFKTLFFSKDGQFVVSTSDCSTIQLLNITNRATKSLKTLNGPQQKFLCDGHYVLSENKQHSSINVQKIVFID